MSFTPEKWKPDSQPPDEPHAAPVPERPPIQDSGPFSPTDYVGIEIENMPSKIVDEDRQLELIEQRVFQKQRVIHMNVIDTTLRITFGVPADSKAIEKVARELKRFLSQMNIPIKQINDIIIAPHTTETWEMPVPDAAVEMASGGQDGGFSPAGGDRDLKRITVESWTKFLRGYTSNLYDGLSTPTLNIESAKLILGQLRDVKPETIQARGDPGLKYLVGKTFAEVENVMKHTTVLIARALFGYASRSSSIAGSRRGSGDPGQGQRLTQKNFNEALGSRSMSPHR